VLTIAPSSGCLSQAVIKSVDLKRKQLSLSMRPDRISQGVTNPTEAAAKAAAAAADTADAAEEPAAVAAGDGSGSSKRRLPPAGQLVTGKVSKVLGAGVVIELTKTLKGIVSLTDLHDSWVPQALSGLNPGQFVRARVLGADSAAAAAAGGQQQQQQQQPLVDKHGHLLLSLRPSQGGAVAGVEGWGDMEGAAGAEQQQQQQKGKKKSKQQQQQQAGDGLLDLSSLKHGDKVGLRVGFRV
jgi:transcriptional accessory protein Tex/SPT6